MHFKTFLNTLETYQSKPLSGIQSHLKFAPKTHFQQPDSITPKKAAVLALFYPDNDNNTCILLTKRASYKGTHSAQISFPGGKTTQEDTSLKRTALRETYEEVGIASNKIEIIRALTNVYIPPSNFLVTPFIGYSTKNPSLNINHEVEAIISVRIESLLNDQHTTNFNINNSYLTNVDVPCFKFRNHIIWGATAMILQEIKTLLS